MSSVLIVSINSLRMTIQVTEKLLFCILLKRTGSLEPHSPLWRPCEGKGQPLPPHSVALFIHLPEEKTGYVGLTETPFSLELYSLLE